MIAVMKDGIHKLDLKNSSKKKKNTDEEVYEVILINKQYRVILSKYEH